MKFRVSDLHLVNEPYDSLKCVGSLGVLRKCVQGGCVHWVGSDSWGLIWVIVCVWKITRFEPWYSCQFKLYIWEIYNNVWFMLKKRKWTYVPFRVLGKNYKVNNSSFLIHRTDLKICFYRLPLCLIVVLVINY